MKVLWFTSSPTPDMVLHAGGRKAGSGGHWVGQLLKHVSGTRTVDLAVASAFPGFRETSYREDGVSYYTITQPPRFPAFGTRKADLYRCAEIIRQFRPDIIHVHGSEFFYGLVMENAAISAPMLVSIQGLLGPYSSFRHFFGALTPAEILMSIRLVELPLGLGLVWQFLRMRKGARRERRILSLASGILGRTEWDHAYARAYSPGAAYCHVGEIMRPVFYDTKWNLQDSDQHSIIYTNAGSPRRGTENLLAAVASLKEEFPDIQLRLAGSISQRSGYGRFLRRRVDELGISDRIVFLSHLDGTEMAHALQRAHVFTITSYIENSPNSLAEAMLVGMPCVASYVGGIPSMVHDGVNGLLYPVEEVPVLADKIRSLFLDDQLATRLGGNARRVALENHDPGAVVDQLVAAYHEVCE